MLTNTADKTVAHNSQWLYIYAPGRILLLQKLNGYFHLIWLSGMGGGGGRGGGQCFSPPDKIYTDWEVIPLHEQHVHWVYMCTVPSHMFWRFQGCCQACNNYNYFDIQEDGICITFGLLNSLVCQFIFSYWIFSRVAMHHGNLYSILYYGGGQLRVWDSLWIGPFFSAYYDKEGYSSKKFH